MEANIHRPRSIAKADTHCTHLHTNINQGVIFKVFFLYVFPWCLTKRETVLLKTFNFGRLNDSFSFIFFKLPFS